MSQRDGNPYRAAWSTGLVQVPNTHLQAGLTHRENMKSVLKGLWGEGQCDSEPSAACHTWMEAASGQLSSLGTLGVHSNGSGLSSQGRMDPGFQSGAGLGSPAQCSSQKPG